MTRSYRRSRPKKPINFDPSERVHVAEPLCQCRKWRRKRNESDRSRRPNMLKSSLLRLVLALSLAGAVLSPAMAAPTGLPKPGLASSEAGIETVAYHHHHRHHYRHYHRHHHRHHHHHYYYYYHRHHHHHRHHHYYGAYPGYAAGGYGGGGGFHGGGHRGGGFHGGGHGGGHG